MKQEKVESGLKENIKFSKKKHVFPYVILAKLVRNSVILDFSICILLFALYMIGNFQAFTDATQLRILVVLSIASAVLNIISFLGIIAEIVFIFLKSRKSNVVFSILLYIFSMIIGFGLIAFSTVIRRISVGI